MTFVETADAPAPAGHYTQAVVSNGLAFVSGILPITPDGQKLTDSTIADQTKQVLANLEAILAAAGSGRERVLKVTVFVADIDAWGTVNQLYAEFFGSHRPARSIVPISTLHYGLQLELEAIAAV